MCHGETKLWLGNGSHRLWVGTEPGTSERRHTHTHKLYNSLIDDLKLKGISFPGIASIPYSQPPVHLCSRLRFAPFGLKFYLRLPVLCRSSSWFCEPSFWLVGQNRPLFNRREDWFFFSIPPPPTPTHIVLDHPQQLRPSLFRGKDLIPQICQCFPRKKTKLFQLFADGKQSFSSIFGWGKEGGGREGESLVLIDLERPVDRVRYDDRFRWNLALFLVSTHLLPRNVFELEAAWIDANLCKLWVVSWQNFSRVTFSFS